MAEEATRRVLLDIMQSVMKAKKNVEQARLPGMHKPEVVDVNDIVDFWSSANNICYYHYLFLDHLSDEGLECTVSPSPRQDKRVKE